jgi:hypothetical protein
MRMSPYPAEGLPLDSTRVGLCLAQPPPQPAKLILARGSNLFYFLSPDVIATGEKPSG